MRKLLYNLGVNLYGKAISIASPFNLKAKKWVTGRKGWIGLLKDKRKEGEKWAWFHCASLGEFEQGRTLMESLKAKYPQQKIILTFFSPSGYEIRKNYPGADHVCYLPLDNKKNVKTFLDILRPSIVFFIKYEIWVNYLLAMKKRKIPVFLVSALIRPQSRFLKGLFVPLFREAFRCFEMIFSQNEETRDLLINFTGNKTIVICGDTRFDRVLSIKNNFHPSDPVGQFIGKDFCIVCGSTWPEDEKIILSAIDKTKNMPVKWIIAPHEIHREKIATQVVKQSTQMISLSLWMKNQSEVAAIKTLWIDNIGMLSTLYYYSDFAYVGGAFGKGIHNTLEAAVYGNPVVFGPNYQKSEETVDMIKCGTAFSITDADGFMKIFDQLKNDQQGLKSMREKNIKYVAEHAGATEKIMKTVEVFLKDH